MRITFKNIAKSLTGISTPVFGLSWKPPETDRDVVRKLIVFLEDRRALYNPYYADSTPRWVLDSVLEIRRTLTETLASIEQESDIAPHLRGMRAACRKFMNEMDETKQRKLRRGPYLEEFFTALGEMRAIFGVHVAQLCVKYGIDVEGDLSKILPIRDDAKGRKGKGRNAA